LRGGRLDQQYGMWGGNSARDHVLLRAAAALKRGNVHVAGALSSAAEHNRRVAMGLEALDVPTNNPLGRGAGEIAPAPVPAVAEQTAHSHGTMPAVLSPVRAPVAHLAPGADRAAAVLAWLRGDGAPVSLADVNSYARGRVDGWEFISSLIPENSGADVATAILFFADPVLFTKTAGYRKRVRARVRELFTATPPDRSWRTPAPVVLTLMIMRYVDFAPKFNRSKTGLLKKIAKGEMQGDNLKQFSEMVLDALLDQPPLKSGVESLFQILAGVDDPHYDTSVSTALVIREAAVPDVARVFLFSEELGYGTNLRMSIQESGLWIAQSDDLLTYMDKYIAADEDTSGLLLDDVFLYSVNDSAEETYQAFVDISAQILLSINLGSLSLWSAAARRIAATTQKMARLKNFKDILPTRLQQQKEMRAALESGREIMNSQPVAESWDGIKQEYETVKKIAKEIRGKDMSIDDAAGPIAEYTRDAMKWYLGNAYTDIENLPDQLYAAISGEPDVDIDGIRSFVARADGLIKEAQRSLGLSGSYITLVPAMDRANYLLAFYNAYTNWNTAADRILAMNDQTPAQEVQTAFSKLEGELAAMERARRMSTGYNYESDTKFLADTIPKYPKRDLPRWVCIQILCAQLLRGEWFDFQQMFNSLRVPALSGSDSSASADFIRTCIYIPVNMVRGWFRDAARDALDDAPKSVKLVKDDTLTQLFVAMARIETVPYTPLEVNGLLRNSIRKALAKNIGAFLQTSITKRTAAIALPHVKFAALQKNKAALAAKSGPALLAALFPEQT